jgi:hypothetical protein
MTVQTAKRSLNGDSDNWLDHKVFLSEMQIINKNKVISNMRFGAFAIIVSVSISACAGDGTLMSAHELEYFDINTKQDGIGLWAVNTNIATAHTPEPATLALIGAGLLGMARRRVTRKRTS